MPTTWKDNLVRTMHGQPFDPEIALFDLGSGRWVEQWEKENREHILLLVVSHYLQLHPVVKCQIYTNAYVVFYPHMKNQTW